MGKNNGWNPPDEGSKGRSKMPSSVFLVPSQKKYPVKKNVNGKWVYNKAALRSAISCANRAGDTAVANRASKILEKLNGKSKK